MRHRKCVWIGDVGGALGVIVPLGRRWSSRPWQSEKMGRVVEANRQRFVCQGRFPAKGEGLRPGGNANRAGAGNFFNQLCGVVIHGRQRCFSTWASLGQLHHDVEGLPRQRGDNGSLSCCSLLQRPETCRARAAHPMSWNQCRPGAVDQCASVGESV